ncbi:DUF4333 domain-containing protein [Mycolicibacterium stellerae]|uniref:DUF4333 domain-containing protein n=1 Tax=Mycolicibacterium stellerae TaxID=2358193 RepID=UPI000F0B6A48|nr:DUF4333 domain-containing protein [Mycolicibacterium stellerae]
MRRLVGSMAWAAAAVATAVACSFSAGSGVSVDKNDLAKEISAQLEKQVGRAPESVDCPDDLKGEVGATTRCTLNDAGKTYGVDVNVTKVEGTDVKFDLKVDDKPQ